MLPRTSLSYRSLRGVLCAALLSLSVASATLSLGQEPAPTAKEGQRGRPTAPQLESKAPQPETDKKGYTIGVSVDLVVMHTSVTDKKGHFVGGLKKDKFKVFEDGVEQQITAFSQEDVPLTMGVVMDLSGSMRNKIDQVNKAALAFIRASNPDDQVFLVGFNDEVELVQDFTSDIDEITDSLENTIITGGTALYDAIYLGVQKAQSGQRPKKAIVVISDGEDRDSYYKLDELISKVQESDVQVFCIGYLNTVPDKGLFGHWSKSVPEKAQEALVRIADETGGKAYFPNATAEIHGIVAEIAHELRNQYSLGYLSSNAAHDGSWRRVKVTVDGAANSGDHVRHRRGYYAPKSVAITSRSPKD